MPVHIWLPSSTWQQGSGLCRDLLPPLPDPSTGSLLATTEEVFRDILPPKHRKVIPTARSGHWRLGRDMKQPEERRTISSSRPQAFLRRLPHRCHFPALSGRIPRTYNSLFSPLTFRACCPSRCTIPRHSPASRATHHRPQPLQILLQKQHITQRDKGFQDMPSNPARHVSDITRFPSLPPKQQVGTQLP